MECDEAALGLAPIFQDSFMHVVLLVKLARGPISDPAEHFFSLFFD
jgi:hypothetical protein